MTSYEVAGTVSELYRFPVKSMGGEQLDEADVTAAGIPGDRAYALIDAETGKVVSAKSVRLFPGILDCRARYVTPPGSDGDVPPVEISLPGGTAVASDASDADSVLSAHFGREVTLARAAPEDFTIDMYHTDVEGADPRGRQDTIVEQKLGAALFTDLGVDSPVPPGSFFDVFPLSVMTTSTLARLRELEPDTDFDLRRFRMNVIVDTTGAGFVENGWVGRELGVGDGVRLAVSMADSRCVMTTLAQDDLPRDTNVMRALVRHNRIQVGEIGKYPVAGVYAVVAAQGALRVGDPVTLD